MRILHVASEVAPWAQTGGLADVAGALPIALMRQLPDATIATFAPRYRGVDVGDNPGVPPLQTEISLGPHTFAATVYGLVRHGVRRYWLDIPHLFDRDLFYGPNAREDFNDNYLRFAVLCKAAIDLAPHLLGGIPDVLHAHDWQGALACAYAEQTPEWAGCLRVMTIHNLAYQGNAPGWAWDELGLSPANRSSRRSEHWGHPNLMKGGIAAAHLVTTVSPTYAHEILTPQRGESLDGFLRHDIRPIHGITNGIDVESWNPANDADLTVGYDAEDPLGKHECRRLLAAEASLPIGEDEPLLAVVSRFADQKGLERVADLVPHLHELGARLVILGGGDPELESRFHWLGDVFRDHVKTWVGFSRSRARRVYGGADMFLMPSHFEPCGLGQLYAMRYGAVPIVSSVGGLVDTVDDVGDVAGPARLLSTGTGFRFPPDDNGGLRHAVQRAVSWFHDHAAWRALQRRCMQRDSSWDRSAAAYIAAYTSARPD